MQHLYYGVLVVLCPVEDDYTGLCNKKQPCRLIQWIIRLARRLVGSS